MKNMSTDEVLILRQVRRKIIEICDCIDEQNWNAIREHLKEMVAELSNVIPKHSGLNEIMGQCRECAQKANYLRLRDLLMYDMDYYIADCLFALDQGTRMLLAEEARRKNEDVLRLYHKDILSWICNKRNKLHIECSYIGAENVNISIIEGEQKFRLFSNTNPCLEGNILANGFEKGVFDEIYVLGFGGGHFIRELQRKFCEAKIKVYLPNIDIFRTVLYNIPIADILESKQIQFCFDSTCLIYLLEINEKLEKNERIGLYINKQELRACSRSAVLALSWIRKYRYEMDYRINDIKNSGKPIGQVKEETIGGQINKYMINFTV